MKNFAASNIEFSIFKKILNSSKNSFKSFFRIIFFREKIFGYNGLRIVLYYTDASMFILPEISYERHLKTITKSVRVNFIYLVINFIKDC